LFAGTHNLTITDATGCTAYGTGIINQPQPLTLTTSPNINICNAQNAQIYATATGGVPIYSYTWNPTNDSTSGITVSPSNTTTYSVSAIDQNGCIIGPKSILITVRPPLSTNILGPDTICIGSTATFNTSVNGGLGTYIYSWIPVSQSASNLTVLPSNPGQYIYSVIVKDGCSLADTAQVSLVVNSKPSIVFVSNINEGCIPLTVNYTSSASSAGNINWDFGDSNSGNGNSITHTYNQSGSFNVSAIIVSPEGCSDTIVKTDYITVFPLPQADFNFSPKDELDVFNSEVSFTDNSTIPFTWLWNFGDSLSNFSNYTSIVQNPVHVFKDTGEYCITLLVTSDKGCKDTTVKCLYIKPSVAIYIPNAFTPNEDGINEGFKPIHVGIVDEDYSFMIFDRWGNLIYQTKNRFDSWDGTLNDEPCQIDTYIYRLQCKDIHTNPHNYTGQVHLVR
jgi:gliding motility-associated-like protein